MSPDDPDAVADAADIDLHLEPAAPPAVVGRAKLTLIVAPIVVLWLMNFGGSVLFGGLVDQSPILLMGLSPANKNVVFAAYAVQAGTYPFLLYFVVGFVRLLAPDASFYALGYLYGDRAIVWMEHRTKTLGRSLRNLETLFTKAGPVLVLILPNNPVCLLAGAARMRTPLFVTLNLVGTAGRMFVLYLVGDALSSPITWFLEIVKNYRPWFLAAGVLSAVFLAATEFRKGTSDVQQLMHLPEDLEPEEDS